jgi:hypothetical protein
MEQFKEAKQLLKLRVKDIVNGGITDEDLRELSCTEVDEMLALERVLWKETDYSVRTDRESRFRALYLDALQDDDRVSAMFFWRTTSGSADLRKHRDSMIQLVNKRKIDAEFKMLWDLFTAGSVLLLRHHVASLCTEFLEYVADRKSCRELAQRQLEDIASADTPDDCDERIGSRSSIMRAEAFWVDVIASSPPPHIERLALARVATDSDPILRLQPTTVTRFTEGDLLPQIAKHYESAALAPVIRYRRALGAIKGHQGLYTLNSLLKEGGYVFCDSLAIEFPHLCYVYVQRVEIDVFQQSFDKEPVLDFRLSSGNDYIMRHFSEYKDTSRFTKSQEVTKTLSDENSEADRPSSYISISTKGYINLAAVRVFGEALVLV